MYCFTDDRPWPPPNVRFTEETAAATLALFFSRSDVFHEFWNLPDPEFSIGLKMMDGSLGCGLGLYSGAPTITLLKCDDNSKSWALHRFGDLMDAAMVVEALPNYSFTRIIDFAFPNSNNARSKLTVFDGISAID